MKLNDKPIKNSPSLNIKQKRSKVTYDALIKTGFRLLKTIEWETITIAELAKSAGYSVGAFYGRFKSKDEFFDSLVAHQLKAREADLDSLFATYNGDDFIQELIKYLVKYHWKYKNYSRAAQVRGMRDPEFWVPIKQSGHELASRTIAKLSEQADRPLTASEEINIRFAFQITFGIINNSVINNPGPIFMNQKLFLEKLTQAFRLISYCDKFKKGK